MLSNLVDFQVITRANRAPPQTAEHRGRFISSFFNLNFFL